MDDILKSKEASAVVGERDACWRPGPEAALKRPALVILHNSIGTDQGDRTSWDVVLVVREPLRRAMAPDS